MKHLLAHIGFLLLLPTLMFGQNPTFEATVSQQTVALGQRFQLTYTINTNGTKFLPPNLSGFQIVSGPNQSQNMQWVNGNMSASTSLSYILVATKEGQITIPAAGMVVGGKTIKSNTVTIQVTKGQVAPQSPNTKGGNQNGEQNLNAEIAQNLFIKAFVDKNKAFVGEQLVVTYKIYTKLSIVNNAINKLPDFNGFYTKDIEIPNGGQLEVTTVNGQRFNVATLKKSILIPQRSGKLEVDPLSLDVVIRIKDNQRPRSVFDQFFGGYRDIKYLATSNRVMVDVEPLPLTGKPKDFNGAVGQFSMKTSVDKDSVEANEALNLKITFSGSGNLSLIENPEIQFPEDFEVYDPKITEKSKPTEYGISGSKTLEYLIIPRFGGNFEIPSFTFSYFDTNDKKYKSISSPVYNIQVGKSTTPSSNSPYRSVKKEDVKLLGSDIRYIQTGNPNLAEPSTSLFKNIYYYFGYLFTLGLLFLFLFLTKQKNISASDLILLRSKRASKEAFKKLKAAREALKNQNKTAFYEALLKGVNDFLSGKLNIPVADLTHESINNALTNHKVSNETTVEILNILEQCEMARYAPSFQLSEDEVLSQTELVIQKIEKEYA